MAAIKFWTQVTDFKFWIQVADFGFWTLVEHFGFRTLVTDLSFWTLVTRIGVLNLSGPDRFRILDSLWILDTCGRYKILDTSGRFGFWKLVADFGS